MLKFASSLLLAIVSLIPQNAAKPVEGALAEAPRCAALTPSQIGQLPLDVQVGSEKIRFVGWKTTDLSAQTVVGFDVEAAVPLDFSVRAGDRSFAGRGRSFLHPLGVVGPKVAAINSLTLCL